VCRYKIPSRRHCARAAAGARRTTRLTAHTTRSTDDTDFTCTPAVPTGMSCVAPSPLRPSGPSLLSTVRFFHVQCRASLPSARSQLPAERSSYAPHDSHRPFRVGRRSTLLPAERSLSPKIPPSPSHRPSLRLTPSSASLPAARSTFYHLPPYPLRGQSLLFAPS
jgi:hypothetical protein